MNNSFTSIAAASVALFCFAPFSVSAQDAAETPAAVAPSTTNSVEITAAAMKQLVTVLASDDLNAESALTAFNTASQEIDKALLLAKMDLAQARQDLKAYNESGKADEMDALMEKASNSQLQKLLNSNDEVGKAYVKFISALGKFDRLLNGN